MKNIIFTLLTAALLTACSKGSGENSSTSDTAALGSKSASSLSVEASASLNISAEQISQITSFLASLMPQVSRSNVIQILSNANAQIDISKTLSCPKGGSVLIDINAQASKSVSTTQVNAGISSSSSSISFNDCTIGKDDKLVLNGTIMLEEFEISLGVAINLGSHVHSFSAKDEAQLISDLTVAVNGKTHTCPINISQSDNLSGTLDTNNKISLSGTAVSQLQGSICGSTLSKNFNAAF